MASIEKAAILGGVFANRQDTKSSPTNLHIISGEVAEKSEDGTVSILMDGLVYSAEDSQYIEIDTIGGLEEGDSATILLSGENGHAMTPLALGSIGSVDRVVEKIDLVVDDLEANYAHITEGVIDNARIDQADVNGLSATYATINSLEAEEARVDGLLANKANVSDLTAATARIGTIEADYIKSDDMEAEEIRVNNLLADKADVSDLNAATARIGTIEADYIKSDDMEAEEIRVNNLLADKADVTDLTAATGRIGQLEADTADIATIRANSAKVQNLTAAQLEADHATIGSLDTNYARIDMANVNNAWIANGVIKDAAITNEMVADISANKLTAGTINGSVINVTNLNADNLTVGTINGARIGEGSLSLSKLDEAVYTESEVDSMVTDLNNRIDAQIETWTVDTIPTLNNTPASAWNTDKLKSEHVGDICYVINASSDYDGYTYRFAYDNTAKVYKWVLIKDNQVTAALGRISDLENFESTTSTWIEQTDEGLSTIRSNHTTLAGIVDKTIVSTTQLWFTKANTTAPSKPTAKVTSTSTAGNAWRVVVPAYNASYPNYYYCYQWEYADGTFGWSAVTRDISMGETQSNSRTALTNAASAQSTADTAAANASSALTQVATKVESSTFNTLKNTVDENSADITTLTTITENNGLTSTTNITNTVNTVSQTASGNSSKISQLATTLGTNADGTTKEGDIVHRTSAVEQDLDGFKTTVSNTYATKTEAYQTARPNLGPFLGYPAGSTDYFATVTYPIYSSEARTHGIMAPWEDRAGYVARQEDDAWLYIDYDFSSVTSGNTYINFITKKQTWLKPSTLYTVLVEWRDDGSVIPSGKGWRVYWTNDTGCFPVGYATGSKTTPTDFEDRYEVTSKDTSGIEAASYFARSYVFMNNSVHLKGWLRVSLYEGSYEGPYKPYAGAQLFATGSDLTSITERVTQAESIIEQHSDSIALKANSADVYTKQQSDGLISTEVTNRNAAITEATDAINLSVSEMYSTKTEAYQTARPNLIPQPMFSTTTDIGDGWLHVEYTNTSSSVASHYWSLPHCDAVIPGETYTIMVEFRNWECSVEASGNYMYIQQIAGNQFWGGNGIRSDGKEETREDYQTYIHYEDVRDGSMVAHIVKVADTEHNPTATGYLFRYRMYTPANSTNSFDIRLSLYEGDYAGPYKPYVDQSLSSRVKSAEATLTVQAGQISSKVETDGVISAINQSAEEIQIQANKVAIDGTAIFSAIQDDVDDAITDKGYQTSSQVESAITSKGYATTTQAQGYATTAKSEATTAAATDATTKADAAQAAATTAANNATDTKLRNYSTTQQMNTAIGDAVDEIEVGGRNLYVRSTTVAGYLNPNDTISTGHPCGERMSVFIPVEEGSTYQYQTWNDSESEHQGWWCIQEFNSEQAFVRQIKREYFSGGSYLSYKRTVPSGVAYVRISARWQDDGANYQLVKMEKGTKATDWTPAPEDVANDISSVKTTADAAAPKANAVKRTQRIYYRSSSSTKPTAMPTAWVAETGDKWAANATTAANWSTKVTPIANGTGESVTKYLYLWTCEQREMADGTLAYTNVLLDDSTTVIDGGKIITGSVSANSVDAASGTFDVANIPDLNASKITAGTLDAARIGTGSIEIGKLDADSKAMLAGGGLAILWNYSAYGTANNGEAYICRRDPLTKELSDANGSVMWDGIERTVPKGMVNPNSIHPFNVPIYVVCRLSSASATTGTNYVVSYNSGWKGGTIGSGALSAWTWAEATDMVLGKFVMTAAEGAMSEMELYDPPLTSKQVTTDTVTARSANANASNAAKTATNFITSINDDGIWVTPSDAKPASDGKVTDSTSGWHISSVLELIKSGVNVFKVWLEGVITKVRIGQADSGHIIIDNDSVDIMNDSSELASFGADGADFMGGLVTLRANAESTIVDDVTYASSDGSIYGRSSEVEGSAGIATSLTTEQRQDGTTSTARSSIEAIPSGSENTASAKIEAYSTYDTDDGRSGHVLLRGDDLIFQSGSAASEEKVIPMNKMFRTYDFVSWESGTANRHLVVAAGICHCYFQGGSNARGNNHVLFTLPAECIPKVEKHVPFTVNAASGNTFAGGHAVINPTTGVCSVSQIYPTGIQGRIYINATWPVV